MNLKSLLIRGVFWRGIFLLSSFLLNIVIARKFEATGSGWLFYASSIYAFFLLISSLSLETGVSFHYAAGNISSKQATLFSLGWTMLASSLLCLLIINPEMIKAPGVSKLDKMIMSASFISGNFLIGFFLPLFYAKKNYRLPNLILGISTIAAIPLIEFARTEKNALYPYFLSFLAAGVLLFILFSLKKTDSYKEKNSSIGGIRKIFSYSLIAFVSNVFTFLLLRADYFFVDRFCSDAELGNYIQVTKICQLFFVIPTIVGSVIFSLTASGDKVMMPEKITRLMGMLFWVGFFLCFVLAIMGYWLFPFLFGRTFDNMFIPFLLSIPAILSICMIYPLSAYFSGAGKLRVNLLGVTIAMVVIIVGDILFIPLFGIEAAAVMSSVSYSLYFGFLLYKFSGWHPINFKEFFLTKDKIVNIKSFLS